MVVQDHVLDIKDLVHDVQQKSLDIGGCFDLTTTKSNKYKSSCIVALRLGVMC